MTLKQLLEHAAARLQPKRIVCEADRNLGRFEAQLLLAHTLKRDRAWLVAHERDTLPAPLVKKFRALVTRRAKREPVAYIVGEKNFYGRPFMVNRHVLIPRPETELLIDLMLKRLQRQNRGLIWDAGTGSGAVGVTLAAELPRSSVIATDASAKAIIVADANANRHGVVGRMHLLKADLLGPAVLRLIKRHLKSRPLFVTANLPYLPVSDRKKICADVVKYEPGGALFAGSDGLTLNKRLLEQIAASGLEPRAIFLEFDPPQANKLKALAVRLFPLAKISVHRDLAKRNRVLEIAG